MVLYFVSEKPLIKEESTSSEDEEKVAAAVEAMQEGFLEGFKNTVGAAAEATMTADGTKIVFRLQYTTITAEQVKAQGEDAVEEICDTMIEIRFA